MQLLQPQEVEVFYLLPAIRRELSIAMKAQGRSQKEIADLLGVTPAAVSQYLHEKRAKALPAEFQERITCAAKDVKDKESMIRETQQLVAHAKRSKLVCKLHAQHAEVPKGCEVCFK